VLGSIYQFICVCARNPIVCLEAHVIFYFICNKNPNPLYSGNAVSSWAVLEKNHDSAVIKQITKEFKTFLSHT
jgi:hypothetical protein